MGSLAATIVAYPLAILAVQSGFWPLFFIAAIAVFFAAIPFVKKAMKDTGTEDPGWIVIDEVCGIFTVLAFVPSVVIVDCPWLLLLAFGFFRFFDIFKPFGIHKFEKFPGAWGVMADDLLGGIYAGILIGLGLTAYLSLFN
jgi:phosphatidylglycerophosphatase A